MDQIHGSDPWIGSMDLIHMDLIHMDLMRKKIERSRRNGLGIGFVSSRSVQLNQKSEIFHCYNGSGGSSVVADGLMAKNNDHFGDHQGCEQSKSRN